jgi:hypothetical protein
MLAMQYVYCRRARPPPHGCRTSPRRSRSCRARQPRARVARGAPRFDPDLFVSTFALSETPRALQEEIARSRFLDSAALYLVGQEIGAPLWRDLQLDSSSALHDAAARDFVDVEISPYHHASAWELFARRPVRSRE